MKGGIKMASQDERTLRMKEEYVNLFEAGMAPKQIAKKFGLSSWTVYNYLDEIAEKAGVPRESLLVRPHEPPTSRSYTPKAVPVADVAGFRERLKKTEMELSELRANIVTYAELQEELSESFQKEEASWQ